MKNTSKFAKHEFYNLYQRLVMGKMLGADEVDTIPELPGAYVLWLDEAPPRCLKVGVVSRKQENGLREEIETIIQSKTNGAVLVNDLKADKKLGKEFKLNFNKVEDRQKFLREFVYYQILPIPDLPNEEYDNLKHFLESESGLNPRFAKSNKSR